LHSSVETAREKPPPSACCSGLIQPDAGLVRVLGLDPKTDALEIRRRVGYVAEDQTMFGWMRVGQLLSFVAPFYPTWDSAWAKHLSDRFELPLKTRVKHLSKGQGVRVALMLATGPSARTRHSGRSDIGTRSHHAKRISARSGHPSAR